MPAYTPGSTGWKRSAFDISTYTDPGRQNRDFVFVKDVVKANLLAGSVEGVGGGVFNVGTGKSISINELWDNVCRVSDCALEPTYAPRRAGDILESVADIEKTQSTLGFAPDYPFEKGLEPTYQWYKESRIPGFQDSRSQGVEDSSETPYTPIERK